jgi:hypothetical protein
VRVRRRHDPPWRRSLLLGEDSMGFGQPWEPDDISLDARH